MGRHLSSEVLKGALSRIDWNIAAFALAVYFSVTALRALRFILAGARLPFFSAFQIAALHSAILRVMPLRSGELAYAILLKRLEGGGFIEGLASLGMLRLLDLFTILPLAAVTALAWIAGNDAKGGAIIVIAGAFVLGVVYFGLGVISRQIAAILPPLHGSGWKRKLGQFFLKLAEVFDFPLKRRVLLLVLTVLIWTLLILWLYLTLLSIGAVSTMLEGFVVGILGIAGSVLPISLIGSFGPMEAGFALGLAAICQNAELATANSLVASMLTFLANWFIAVPMWFVLLRHKSFWR